MVDVVIERLKTALCVVGSISSEEQEREVETKSIIQLIMVINKILKYRLHSVRTY